MPRRPMTDDEATMRGRKSRAKAPAQVVPVDTDPPPPPSWLSRPAKAEWKRLAGDLHRLGRLQPLYFGAFAAYCVAHGQMVTAARAVRKAGLTATTAGGNVVQSVEQGVLRRATADVTRLGAPFGLSPRAQHGMVDVRPPAAAPAPAKRTKAAKPADDNAHFFAAPATRQ
jgi:P27 family predicted phage terminase small subunit